MSIHFIHSARPQRKQGTGQFFSITKMIKLGYEFHREQNLSRDSGNRRYIKRQL